MAKCFLKSNGKFIELQNATNEEVSKLSIDFKKKEQVISEEFEALKDAIKALEVTSARICLKAPPELKNLTSELYEKLWRLDAKIQEAEALISLADT